MTIRDLKDKLSSMDESSIITLQKKDGTQMDITDASMQGDHFTLWAE